MCSSTQISSDCAGTAAEIPLSTALQAAELFVDHLIELAPQLIIPSEPNTSDPIEKQAYTCSQHRNTTCSTIAGTKPLTFAVSRKAVRCRVTHGLRGMESCWDWSVGLSDCRTDGRMLIRWGACTTVSRHATGAHPGWVQWPNCSFWVNELSGT